MELTSLAADGCQDIPAGENGEAVSKDQGTKERDDSEVQGMHSV